MRIPTLSTPIAAGIVALGFVGASAGSAEARDGCGLGFHRGLYGFCRPNVVYRPFVYRPAFYGYRRFAYGPRWHRWGGYRHVGWGGGWHRGWHGGWGGHHGGWHHRW